MSNKSYPAPALSVFMNLNALRASLPSQSEQRLSEIRTWAEAAIKKWDESEFAHSAVMPLFGFGLFPLVLAYQLFPSKGLVLLTCLFAHLFMFTVFFELKRTWLQELVDDTTLLAEAPDDCCEKALTYVQECPAAKELRDKLLSELRPLRMVHFHQMKEAWTQYEEEQRAQRMRAARSVACKKLHGLT